jgi:hypothetical protein
MPDRPLDSIDLKVANTVMAEAALAYGYRPDHERDPNPDDYCECGHHHEAHHGDRFEGRCDDCPCPAFEAAA